MIFKLKIQWLLIFALFNSVFNIAASTSIIQPDTLPQSSSEVTAYDLIAAMNSLRMSYGLPALIEDPIINAVAQSTAQIMAANQMSWHIGDVSGRLSSAGYGGGAKVWGTENFAVGNHTIDEIMIVWADDSHMIPAVNPAYCNVGAGVAKSANGMTYYVLQAAYTSTKACGEYTSPGGTINQPGDGSTTNGAVSGVSQIVVPVKIASPDADGKVFHVVEAGQSFWAIAVAYKITIKDLELWNNLTKDSKLQIGQRLFIPNSNTQGYTTPTPIGMVQTSTPGPDGKVIHVVQPYQTLITIAQAYGAKVENMLTLNGIQEDWPLQIGQKLVISPGAVTPTPTPNPLTPIQKLTPASDGNYYHIIQSGEYLAWVADLYQVSVNDLMSWNGLNESSIIVPNQKILLRVTPPATATYTPAPATATPTATPIQPTQTPTRTATQETITPTPASKSLLSAGIQPGEIAAMGLLAGALFVVMLLLRKK